MKSHLSTCEIERIYRGISKQLYVNFKATLHISTKLSVNIEATLGKFQNKCSWLISQENKLQSLHIFPEKDSQDTTLLQTQKFLQYENNKRNKIQAAKNRIRYNVKGHASSGWRVVASNERFFPQNDEMW